MPKYIYLFLMSFQLDANLRLDQRRQSRKKRDLIVINKIVRLVKTRSANRAQVGVDREKMEADRVKDRTRSFVVLLSALH